MTTTLPSSSSFITSSSLAADKVLGLEPGDLLLAKTARAWLCYEPNETMFWGRTFDGTTGFQEPGGNIYLFLKEIAVPFSGFSPGTICFELLYKERKVYMFWAGGPQGFWDYFKRYPSEGNE